MVIHTFGGEHPDKVSIPVKGNAVKKIMCSEDNEVSLENGMLTVALKAEFEAVAVYL